MVVWTTKIGCILGIDDAILGLTILAIGTSTPDMLTSIYVAMDKNIDMAVTNALGSNIFDILVALGIPWFIWTLVGFPVAVNGGDFTLFTIILFVVICALFLTLKVTNWKLTPKTGWFLVSLYALFVLFDIIYSRY